MANNASVPSEYCLRPFTIDRLPFHARRSGLYVLRRNLALERTNQRLFSAITVSADNVTIDLRDHCLFVRDLDASQLQHPVIVINNCKNVRIFNGYIACLPNTREIVLCACNRVDAAQTRFVCFGNVAPSFHVKRANHAKLAGAGAAAAIASQMVLHPSPSVRRAVFMASVAWLSAMVAYSLTCEFLASHNVVGAVSIANASDVTLQLDLITCTCCADEWSVFEHRAKRHQAARTLQRVWRALVSRRQMLRRRICREIEWLPGVGVHFFNAKASFARLALAGH